jgi:aa3 type cytochrome c oxidase subunit IV
MGESGGMNIDQQKESWNNFVKLFLWGTIGCGIITIIAVAVIS